MLTWGLCQFELYHFGTICCSLFHISWHCYHFRDMHVTDTKMMGLLWKLDEVIRKERYFGAGIDDRMRRKHGAANRQLITTGEITLEGSQREK